MTTLKKLMAAVLAIPLGVLAVGCADKSEDTTTDRVVESQGKMNRIRTSGNAKLPEGWPEELTIPDSMVLEAASTSSISNDESMVISGTSDQSMEDVFVEMQEIVSNAEFEVIFERTSAEKSSFSSEKGKETVTVAIVPAPADSAKSYVTISYSAN